MKLKFHPGATGKRNAAYVTAILFFTIISFSANAQKNIVGVNGGVQWGNGYGLQTVFGLNYERKFTAHSGIETGISLYRRKYGMFLDPATMKTSYSTKEYYLNITIMYKYYSNIINVAAGPTLNIYTGSTSIHPTLNYSALANKKVSVGYLFKVSKTFNVNDKFIIEPELTLGNRAEFKTPMPGAGVSFKYRF